LFGTIDTWLLYHLTGGTVHATDVTNASRTLMMDLATLQWDDQILKDLNIPKQMLPQVPTYLPTYIAVSTLSSSLYRSPETPSSTSFTRPSPVLPSDPAVLRALRPRRRVLTHGPGGRAGRGRAG
jgi:hypothetical protein